MKILKELFAISFLSAILTVLMIMQCCNIPTTAEVTLPYKMDYKTFPVQPYAFSSSLITNGSIKYLSLPSDSLPMGILYDSAKNKVWIALYCNSSIAEIDVSTMSTTIYPLPEYIDSNDPTRPWKYPSPWTLSLTPDGNVWIAIRDFKDGPLQCSVAPFLGKLDPANNYTYFYYLPKSSGCDIKFYNDHIWYLTNNGLLKINYTSEEIVESYLRDFSGGFMQPDGDSLWLSSVSGDFITRFNTTTRYFDVNLTGFDRPLGIYVDFEYIYVAENSENIGTMGTIAKINKTSLQITRLNTANITNMGPYHVLKDSFGYLWFTDNSGHLGIVGGIVYNSISPYCYFMTEVPGSSIWFSAVGSAYVGIKGTETLGKSDVNKDGVVDIYDLILIAKIYGSTQGELNWNSNCDVNNDGKIDIYDLILIAGKYGQTL
jgi:hypothetical protein